jgi:formamidopyrimidine-DNA glycosylase
MADEERKGQKCPQCGKQMVYKDIKRGSQKRRVYWCPDCQEEPQQ